MTSCDLLENNYLCSISYNHALHNTIPDML